jgi:hypothetical protein
MFPLHDRTRRFICRTVFLLCAVLPSITIAGWCLWMRAPNRAEAVRARLESALGLSVRLSNVSYPRPGCTLLKDVELADLDVGRTVASARLVEISDDAQGEIIFASQPDIDATAIAHWQVLIEAMVRRPAGANSKMLRIAANELTLHWPSGAQTFVNCSAQVESTEDGTAAEATLGVANSDAAQPIRFQWHRSNVTGEPVASMKLQADGDAMPLSLLAALVEHSNHFGPHSTLEGNLTAMETPDGWQAELAGHLKNVDLHWVVSEQFPHQLSGNAELNIKHAVVHSGRLEELQGTIHAGPGAVSPSLIAAATAMLGLTRGGGPGNSLNATGDRSFPVNVNSYEELAAEFTLDTSGFFVRGLCGGKPSGIVMRNRDGVLLADSERGPVPVVAFLKMLVPDSRVQVPATRQTDWLLNLLPIPDVVPGDPQAVPQARFRGGKDLH